MRKYYTQRLINAPDFPEKKDQLAQVLFMLVGYDDHAESTHLIIQSGIEVNIPVVKGFTALHKEVQSRNTMDVTRLLKIMIGK